MGNHYRKEYRHMICSWSSTEVPDPSHFERHCHRVYELLYVAKGRGRYVVDGTEYPLCDNTLLLLRPYEFHYVCPDKNHPYERFVVYFERDTLMGEAADLSMISNYQKSTNGVYFDKGGICDEVVTSLLEIRDLAQRFENESIEESFARMTLSRMLLLLSVSKPREPVIKQENLIAGVIEYLSPVLIIAIA